MDKLSLKDFDWGWMDEHYEIKPGIFAYHIDLDGSQIELSYYHKRCIIQEIFQDKLYEKFFEVEKDDLVVDVGASLGPFTYSILHKNPHHIYCFEPSVKEFKTLNKNLRGYPVTTINKGISNINSVAESNQLFGGESEMETITFKTFIENYSIDKIDFLKTDCEGGEYDIFNKENFDWVTNNIKKIVGEWHLSTPELKSKFREFRDTYLNYYQNYEIMSVDGHFIKWDLWNEHFIEYYNEVIINIDNR